MAGVESLTQLMAVADLKNDGDYKLIVADAKGKLKIYMGTSVIYNEKINEKPTAIETFYDSTKKPMLPYIAIAAGSTIFYY